MLISAFGRLALFAVIIVGKVSLIMCSLYGNILVKVRSMPTTDTEKKLLRREKGDSLTSFPDEDVDLLFSKAETEYSVYSHQVQLQAVAMYRIDELLTASIPDVTYQQNETRENRTDIQKGLEGKLVRAQKRLDELLAVEKPIALRTAVMKVIPTRIKGYPNG